MGLAYPRVHIVVVREPHDSRAMQAISIACAPQFRGIPFRKRQGGPDAGTREAKTFFSSILPKLLSFINKHVGDTRHYDY